MSPWIASFGLFFFVHYSFLSKKKLCERDEIGAIDSGMLGFKHLKRRWYRTQGDQHFSRKTWESASTAVPDLYLPSGKNSEAPEKEMIQDIQ